MFSIWFNENTIPQKLIRISRLTVEAINNQNLFTKSNWLIGFRAMSSFVQVVISENELKLLGSVEKWITLNGDNFLCTGLISRK